MFVQFRQKSKWVTPNVALVNWGKSGLQFGWDTEARLGILGKVHGMNSMAVFYVYWMAKAGVQSSLVLGGTIAPALHINYVGLGVNSYKYYYRGIRDDY
jgi:hypothetical protein